MGSVLVLKTVVTYKERPAMAPSQLVSAAQLVGASFCTSKGCGFIPTQGTYLAGLGV